MRVPLRVHAVTCFLLIIDGQLITSGHKAALCNVRREKKNCYICAGEWKSPKSYLKRKITLVHPPPPKKNLRIVTLVFVLSRCREFGFSISRTEGICDRNRKLKRGRSPPLRRSCQSDEMQTCWTQSPTWRWQSDTACFKSVTQPSEMSPFSKRSPSHPDGNRFSCKPVATEHTTCACIIISRM